MKNFEYFKPSDLKEASDLLLEFNNALIINGGTDMVVRLRNELVEPEALIDIKNIPGLKNITEDEKSITIGSCVTMNEMVHNKAVIDSFKLLCDAVHYVGSGQVRNLATMVGNICNASPLADTATPLLVYEADILVYSTEGEREIPICDFFKGVRKTALKKGEVVTGVKIPKYNEEKGLFKKVSRRKEVDLSTVCASVAKLDGDIRISFGSVAPVPLRARKTEEFLKNKELTDDVIEEAAKISRTEVSPIDDIRASKGYRLDMVELSVVRGLEEIRGY
ncbi:MAG: xanthine dehydrogenase family protein subunit M [Clostridiales bacterium]|nr:xanthine dehydrogenase family protein subunit M [Clostridiales bacterium]